MRPIEKNLRGNPRELDSACPRLTRKVGTLLDAVPDRRRAELRAACDELDARLARKADLPDKLAAFRDLRDAAVQWFYDLDRLLMGRCEELTLINAALGAVLDIVIGAKP